MALTVPKFKMYARELDDIRRSDWLMQLAIATNPHIPSEAKQKELWRQLKPRPRRPLRTLSPEHKKMAEQFEEYLAKRDKK